jgi:hypothetical protein
MRIVEASNGTNKVQMSREDWRSIGITAGWINLSASGG